MTASRWSSVRSVCLQVTGSFPPLSPHSTSPPPSLTLEIIRKCVNAPRSTVATQKRRQLCNVFFCEFRKRRRSTAVLIYPFARRRRRGFGAMLTACKWPSADRREFRCNPFPKCRQRLGLRPSSSTLAAAAAAGAASSKYSSNNACGPPTGAGFPPREVRELERACVWSTVWGTAAFTRPTAARQCVLSRRLIVRYAMTPTEHWMERE